MSDTRVSLLTPPGTGAIAAISLAGPKAWEIATKHFRPFGKPLPDSPPLHHFYFGHLGEGVGDEVILAVKRIEPEVVLEFHCHGGQRIVQWLIELLLNAGAKLASDETELSHALSRAPTLRTANILLDQFHGAFERAIRDLLAVTERNPEDPRLRFGLTRLISLTPLGRHLVNPWKIAIAGPPNVGKSSLVNALVGFQRSIVAPIPGTTRDVVSVSVAFDGWPVELSDTAGQRESADVLESEGIERAKGKFAEADLVVWLKDATSSEPEEPPATIQHDHLLIVWNKIDLLPLSASGRGPGDGVLSVSASTSLGIPELIAACFARLVPTVPESGEAVPYLPGLASIVGAAWDAHRSGNSVFARAILRTCLSGESQESNRSGG